MGGLFAAPDHISQGPVICQLNQWPLSPLTSAFSFTRAKVCHHSRFRSLSGGNRNISTQDIDTPSGIVSTVIWISTEPRWPKIPSSPPARRKLPLRVGPKEKYYIPVLDSAISENEVLRGPLA